MRRNTLKNKLLDFGYSENSVSKLLQGRMKPTADKMFFLEDSYSIPVNAWRDIKSYLNGTKQHTKQSTTEVA